MFLPEAARNALCAAVFTANPPPTLCSSCRLSSRSVRKKLRIRLTFPRYTLNAGFSFLCSRSRIGTVCCPVLRECRLLSFHRIQREPRSSREFITRFTILFWYDDLRFLRPSEFKAIRMMRCDVSENSRNF